MAKKKKRKLKKSVKLVLIIFVILFIVGIVWVAKPFHTTKEKQNVKVEDTLEDYGYVLNENETAYYKELFKELKSELSKDEVDEEAYATLVAKLFLADFFNLDNKITKNDIGGVQFVYEDYQDDFSKYAVESIYHYVKSNIYKKRDQELPVVTSVEISGIEETSFEYGDEVDEKAYTLKYVITYEKDLGYQEEGEMILIHHGDKLEIASLK